MMLSIELAAQIPGSEHMCMEQSTQPSGITIHSANPCAQSPAFPCNKIFCVPTAICIRRIMPSTDVPSYPELYRLRSFFSLIVISEAGSYVRHNWLESFRGSHIESNANAQRKHTTPTLWEGCEEIPWCFAITI